MHTYANFAYICVRLHMRKCTFVNRYLSKRTIFATSINIKSALIYLLRLRQIRQISATIAHKHLAVGAVYATFLVTFATNAVIVGVYFLIATVTFHVLLLCRRQ